MFNQLSHQQMAAQLRQLIDQQPNHDHQRAVLLLRAFERCAWDANLFMNMVNKVAPDQFTWRDTLQFTASGTANPTTTVADILEHYNQAVAESCVDYGEHP
jgi:hypothetical protein